MIRNKHVCSETSCPRICSPCHHFRPVNLSPFNVNVCRRLSWVIFSLCSFSPRGTVKVWTLPKSFYAISKRRLKTLATSFGLLISFPARLCRCLLKETISYKLEKLRKTAYLYIYFNVSTWPFFENSFLFWKSYLCKLRQLDLTFDKVYQKQILKTTNSSESQVYQLLSDTMGSIVLHYS